MTDLFEYLNVLENLGFGTYVWYKIDMFHISCIISLLFIIFPVLKSRVHSLYLFLSFFFLLWKCTFHADYDLTEYELYFWIIATSARYLSRKMWVRVLWTLFFLFLQNGSCKACQRIIQLKTNAEIQVAWNMHQLENVQGTKCFRGYCNKLQNRITY